MAIGQALTPWQRPLEIAGIIATSFPMAAEEGIASLGIKAGGAAVSDATLVVRGGTNTAEHIAAGAERIDAAGQVHGVSVNSARGASVAELARGIPHNKVGVTTVGAIRAAGGQIAADATRANPNHCLVSCMSSEALSKLLTPVINNPAK